MKEPENKSLNLYAQSLHDAYVRVLKKGMATPDLVGKLKARNKTGVDTASFVKAVRAELSALLGMDEEAQKQSAELKLIMKEIR